VFPAPLGHMIRLEERDPALQERLRQSYVRKRSGGNYIMYRARVAAKAGSRERRSSRW